MKRALVVALFFLSNNLMAQSKKQKSDNPFFTPVVLDYAIMQKDSIVRYGLPLDYYSCVMQLSKNIYFKIVTDTIYVKGMIINACEVSSNRDLSTEFWTIDTIKKHKEYKLAKYYGKSKSKGDFILAIHLITKHPIYFFSNSLSPLMFNYPEFKTSLLFKKLRSFKGWLKLKQ
ncbi:hypothetical protein [Ferruginibacter sp.]